MAGKCAYMKVYLCWKRYIKNIIFSKVALKKSYLRLSSHLLLYFYIVSSILFSLDRTSLLVSVFT